MQGNEELILIGRISGTHGIRGLLRVVPYSGAADSIASLSKFIVRMPNGNFETFRIRSAVEHGKKLLVALEGIQDMNAAVALSGSEIYVRREQLPALPDGEFYWQDLLGLKVLDEQGGVLGELAHIFSTGANDVYVVENDGEEYLIPAIEDVIIKVDLEMRTMTVRPMEGLLDL